VSSTSNRAFPSSGIVTTCPRSWPRRTSSCCPRCSKVFPFPVGGDGRRQAGHRDAHRGDRRARLVRP
jgi:hypothetical protein